MDRRRGMITAATVAFMAGALLSGYGIHAQMSQAAARADARNTQSALDTRAALRRGVVLFMPLDASLCRRRWIDNATWMLRDGGDIACDDALTPDAADPAGQPRNTGNRIDAIRNMFQSRAVWKLD